VFVNAGAITHTKSEAELAGLLAHELSTPCFPTVSISRRGKFIANVTQFVPLGGTIADLFTLDYSRDMERQGRSGDTADCLKGYAADGLRNLMVTLKQQENFLPSWLASHPAPGDRISYLENLIERNLQPPAPMKVRTLPNQRTVKNC